MKPCCPLISSSARFYTYNKLSNHDLWIYVLLNYQSDETISDVRLVMMSILYFNIFLYCK